MEGPLKNNFVEGQPSLNYMKWNEMKWNENETSVKIAQKFFLICTAVQETNNLRQYWKFQEVWV